jgi:hypothetical protein
MPTRTPIHTGGCQCGAVRYALYAEATNPHICHCRMCQKAMGNYFAAFAGVDGGDFAWTRGTPGFFMSSPEVERGFCRDCGTPLSFRYTPRDRESVTLGSLDDPARVPPVGQYGVEARHVFMAMLAGLPGQRTADALPKAWLDGIVSRQHPDHDTPDGEWPKR